LGVKLYLPVDVVAAEAFNAEAIAKIVTIQEIPKDWMGLDFTVFLNTRSTDKR
jgi:phosphoglycerate kinase